MSALPPDGQAWTIAVRGAYQWDDRALNNHTLLLDTLRLQTAVPVRGV